MKLLIKLFETKGFDASSNLSGKTVIASSWSQIRVNCSSYRVITFDFFLHWYFVLFVECGATLVCTCISKSKMIFHILIQLCVCLSVCWCSSDCVCGCLVGKNYACGTETFSCSVSDPTTVILVRKKCPSHNRILLLRQPCWPLTLISVFVFWRVKGITALIELPKNYIAAAMDKKISKSTKYGADEQISRLKVHYLK